MKFTRETVIMMVVLAGLVAGSVLGVYRPQSQAMAALQQDISTRKAGLKSDSDKAGVVPDMLRTVEALKSRYHDFDRRLPRSTELDGFLREITAVQSKCRLSCERMDTQSPVAGQLYNTTPITMRQKGSYLALADFLRQINDMARLTRVQRLIIQAPQDGDGSQLDIELVMNIYFTKT